MTSNVTTQDAQEFGVHIRQGGWRLGLLVARNVQKGSGGPKLTVARTTVKKVSAREFSEQAGTSADRVLRYLAAWNNAADAGHVPHADGLAPGQAVDLDVDSLPDWLDFYPPRTESNTREDRAAATLHDPEKVARVLRDPEARAAVTEAIKSDDDLADAAEQALDDRHDEWKRERPIKPEKKTETARDAKSDATRLIARLRAAHRALQDSVDLAQDIRGDGADHLKEAVALEVAWIRSACDVIELGVNGDSFDEQLQELLNAEGGR